MDLRSLIRKMPEAQAIRPCSNSIVDRLPESESELPEIAGERAVLDALDRVEADETDFPTGIDLLVLQHQADKQPQVFPASPKGRDGDRVVEPAEQILPENTSRIKALVCRCHQDARDVAPLYRTARDHTTVVHVGQQPRLVPGLHIPDLIQDL